MKGTGGSQALLQNNKSTFSMLKALNKQGQLNWLNISLYLIVSQYFYTNIELILNKQVKNQKHKNAVHLKEVHMLMASFWTNSPSILLLSRSLKETDVAIIVLKTLEYLVMSEIKHGCLLWKNKRLNKVLLLLIFRNHQHHQLSPHKTIDKLENKQLPFAWDLKFQNCLSCCFWDTQKFKISETSILLFSGKCKLPIKCQNSGILLTDHSYSFIQTVQSDCLKYIASY